MIRFASDENLHGAIVTGLKRRIPNLDLVRIWDVSPMATDPEVLEWCFNQKRLLVTHDVNTLRADAYDRLEQGLSIAGVLLVPTQLPIAVVLDNLETIALCSEQDDWIDVVSFLPL
jgi:Domain of unknown function (DUF5615)